MHGPENSSDAALPKLILKGDAGDQWTLACIAASALKKGLGA